MNVNQYFCYNCMQSFSERYDRCPYCGSQSNNITNLPNQLPCGTILNAKYLIGRVLGQGGFGITYIGIDLDLQMRVAIKEFFPTGCATRDFSSGTTVQPLTGSKENIYEKSRKRFLSEARVLAQFSDEPGIVNVRDYFEDNGTSYFVMDYIEGESYKKILKEQGPIPIDEVLESLLPVMHALNKVHLAKLLHRDISPDNVILKPNGSAILIDFGAARMLSAKRTNSLSVVVKAGYAPPEQYLSRSEQGAWTDVYALCATIYKMITGKTPPPSLDRQGSGLKLATPSALGAKLSTNQERAILKGLSLAPEKRQQSMQELIDDLYGVRKCSRKMVMCIASGALVALIATVLILTRSGNIKSLNVDQPPISSPTKDVATPTASPTATPAPSDDSEAEQTPPQTTYIPTNTEDFEYHSYDHKISISGYKGNETNIVIPSQIDGLPVTELDWLLFDTNIVSIMIPSTITEIWHGALSIDTLETITVAPENPVFTSVEGVLFAKGMHTIIQYPAAKKDTSYIIPDEVETIDKNCFNDCQFLSSITIPEGVVTIEAYAFSYCKALVEISVPGSVKAIEEDAFNNCEALSKIELKEGLESIASGVFSGCSSLTDISIPGTVKSIAPASLGRALTSIHVDENNAYYTDYEDMLLSKDGKTLFYYPASNSAVNMPDTVTVIEAYALYNCDNIVSVQLPNGIERIEEKAFYDCDKLVRIDLPETLQTIGEGSFHSCDELASITIPASVTSIGNDAFDYCGKLASITVDTKNQNYKDDGGVLLSKDGETLIRCPSGFTRTKYSIPNGIMNIADNAFSNCDMLTSITIPSGALRIGNYAFSSCESLVSVTIPKSVLSINSYAFMSSNKGLTIYGAAGSQAEAFAKKNNILFSAK